MYHTECSGAVCCKLLLCAVFTCDPRTQIHILIECFTAVCAFGDRPVLTLEACTKLATVLDILDSMPMCFGVAYTCNVKVASALYALECRLVVFTSRLSYIQLFSIVLSNFFQPEWHNHVSALHAECTRINYCAMYQIGDCSRFNAASVPSGMIAVRLSKLGMNNKRCCAFSGMILPQYNNLKMASVADADVVFFKMIREHFTF